MAVRWGQGETFPGDNREPPKSFEWTDDSLKCVFSTAALQQNFLHRWKCSESVMSHTGATNHMWLLSVLNVACVTEELNCNFFFSVTSFSSFRKIPQAAGVQDRREARRKGGSLVGAGAITQAGDGDPYFEWCPWEPCRGRGICISLTSHPLLPTLLPKPSLGQLQLSKLRTRGTQAVVTSNEGDSPAVEHMFCRQR